MQRTEWNITGRLVWENHYNFCLGDTLWVALTIEHTYITQVLHASVADPLSR